MSAKTRLIFEGENRTTRAFNSISGSLGRMGTQLRTLAFSAKGFVGILAGGALARALKGQVDYADQVAKTSKTLQTSTEIVSGLGFAAERSNLSFDQLKRGLGNYQDAVAEARKGSKQFADSFNNLALSAHALSRLPLDQQIGIIADQLNKISDPSTKVDVARQLFGGSRGQEFLQLLEEGSTGIAALTAQAREFGVVVGGDQAAAAERAADEMTNLSRSFQGLLLQLADSGALNGLSLLLKSIGELIRLFGGTPKAASSAADGMTIVIDKGNKLNETIRESVALSRDFANVYKAPAINPTVQIIKPVREETEKVKNELFGLQSTLSSAITAGAEEGSQGMSAVFSAALQRMFADLAASSFLQLLTRLLPGLAGGGASGAGSGIAKLFGFAMGGVVPGPMGAPQLAVVHGGESIVPAGSTVSGAGNVYNIDARGAGPNAAAEIRAAIQQAERQTIAKILDQKRRGRFR